MAEKMDITKNFRIIIIVIINLSTIETSEYKVE